MKSTKRHAHYLQHVPFEGLGSMADELARSGFEITCTPFWQAGYSLPDLAQIDLLIIMGGPMSVHDEDQHPWLIQEKQYIREAIQRGIPVLGICLGAQLIADVLGGNVYPHTVKEIGWFPVRRIAEDAPGICPFPPSVTAFHWHGETFDLPPDAVWLAESDGCAHQAFQWQSSVIGLQFHLETTPTSAAALIQHCRDELVEGPFVQTEAQICQVSEQNYHTINKLMNEIIRFLHPAS